MLRADEDGQMLFLHNEFCNIFPSVNRTEKPAICSQKFLTSFNSITRSNCCNVRLNMIKRQKYRMANILNCLEFFLQILKQQKAEGFGSRSLKLQSINRLFESRKSENVKGSNIVKCVFLAIFFWKYAEVLGQQLKSLSKKIISWHIIQPIKITPRFCKLSSLVFFCLLFVSYIIRNHEDTTHP